MVEGNVKCWGNNYWGQLGDGTRADSALLRDVRAPLNVVSIDVGGAHACALKGDAHVYCYLRDEKAVIQRIFPNRFAKDALVSASSKLELPGRQRFQIIANTKGVRETVACYAAERDVMADLPSAVSGSDFAPLALTTLDQVRSAFATTTRNRFEVDLLLEELLTFGSYPGVLNIGNYTEKRNYLLELTSAYLYKDLLELSSIKNAPKMRDLLRLLAYQIGSEVSLNELANTLRINRETVINYIDLLEKAFVIFRISGYNRNLRKEISRHENLLRNTAAVRS